MVRGAEEAGLDQAVDGVHHSPPVLFRRLLLTTEITKNHGGAQRKTRFRVARSAFLTGATKGTAKPLPHGNLRGPSWFFVFSVVTMRRQTCPSPIPSAQRPSPEHQAGYVCACGRHEPGRDGESMPAWSNSSPPHPCP